MVGIKDIEEREFMRMDFPNKNFLSLLVFLDVAETNSFI